MEGGLEGGLEPVLRRFFVLYYGIFQYRIVFVPGFYIGFYARGVLWSTQGDKGDDGQQLVVMGPV